MHRYAIQLTRIICFSLLATALHHDAMADEAAAIAAVREAGGVVRNIAESSEGREVSFHPQGAEAGDGALAQMGQIEGVLWLDLRSTAITDAGLQQVARLSQLERLHLERTGITDAGLVHLAGLSNLEYLNLYDTAVTDAGLVHLRGLSNLKKVFLWQTDVTDEGVAALAEAQPHLEIVRSVFFPPAVDHSPPESTLATGQFVRIRLEGEKRTLSLAEVEVIETTTGIKMQAAGTATQSSVGYEGIAGRGNDGNSNPDHSAGSVTHTDINSSNPWWMVDLGSVKDIGRIRVFNRRDCCGERLVNAIVEILDVDQNVVWTGTIETVSNGSTHVFPEE